MANWNNPTVTSTYANFVTEAKDRDVSAALQFDSAIITDTNLPTNTIRWNSSSKLWQRWDGTAWVALAVTYGISISGGAGSVAWSGVTGKPTTVSGYGITDAITTASIGSQSVSNAANLGSVAAANFAQLAVAQTWTKAQRGAVVILTDAPTITIDMNNPNFIITLAGNRTLGNPSNQVGGQSGIIIIAQNPTGGHTLAFGSHWKFAGGTAPTITTGGWLVDVLAYYIHDSGWIFASLTKDVR